MWFADEARVGQKGTLSYVWAERGSRPLAVRDNRHDSAYLFGAVCPERCIGAAIIMPAVNSEAMAEHLREISTQVAPSAHAVLVLDGAGWHQAGERLPVPDNISMLPLPPYAPELNPVENSLLDAASGTSAVPESGVTTTAGSSPATLGPVSWFGWSAVSSSRPDRARGVVHSRGQEWPQAIA